jgi:hypothetical protein
MLQLANRPSCRRVFDPVGMGFRPRNFMKNRMLAVGQAVSPANRPEGRLPSPLPRGFSPVFLRLGAGDRGLHPDRKAPPGLSLGEINDHSYNLLAWRRAVPTKRLRTIWCPLVARPSLRSMSQATLEPSPRQTGFPRRLPNGESLRGISRKMRLPSPRSHRRRRPRLSPRLCPSRRSCPARTAA